MKTTAIPIITKGTTTTVSRQEVVNFYEEATEDYSFWSSDLNMHFGYYTAGRTNPLTRDSMLNEMNSQIYERLQLPKGKTTIADLGCGMGGPMRHFLKTNLELSVIGVTLSPFQVREGNKLLVDKKGVILHENFCETSMATGSMDGVVGIESLCHVAHSKESLREAFRLLKPGKKFVICDAFIKKPVSQLCPGAAYSYKRLCKGWKLEGLGVIEEVENNLKKIGFQDVKVEDVSFRTAPSVFHVPFAICGFILKKILKGKRIKPESWNNLKASFYALMAGLHMKDFGYYIVTAKK